MKQLLLICFIVGATLSSANAQVAPGACNMNHLQGQPALPEPARGRVKDIFAAAQEATASEIADGLITDRCTLMSLLVGKKITGKFPAQGQYPNDADEVHVFYPDGRFLKYVYPSSFAQGTYQIIVNGKVPVITWKVSGDFTMEGGYAFEVKNKQLIGFYRSQGRRQPLLIQGQP